MTKGLVITPEGHAVPFDGDYPELVKAVGGYIEGCPVDDPDITIWVNEEGKIGANNGDGPQLPRNRMGERIWAHVGSMGCLDAGDWMAGPCVVVGGVDDEGETRDLSEAHRIAILRIVTSS